MLHNFEVLLFDLDDTLFNYSQAWEVATRKAIAIHEFTKDLDADHFYRSYRRLDLELWAKRSQGEISLSQLRITRFLNALSEHGREADEEQVELFQGLFHQAVLDVISPDNSVLQLLQRLRHSYQIGIITNGGEEQWDKLDKLLLTEIFQKQNIWISEEIGCLKPHKDIFNMAVKHFGITANQALFIGDSWDADIVGSINAGLSAIWINSNGQISPTNHQPIAIVKSVLEIEPFLLSGKSNRKANSRI